MAGVGRALGDRTIHPGVVSGSHKEFMMKSLSQRSVLLFGVVLAVCAFVVPSFASAASWSVVGTTHQLFSPNLSFTAGLPPVNYGWSCAASEFHVEVFSASRIEITGAQFQGCTGFGSNLTLGCTVTLRATGLPWTATAVATDNVQIHSIHVDVTFESKPDLSTCNVPADNQFTLTGTLTGGSWNPTSREITLETESGLFFHPNAGGSSLPLTLYGTLRDTTGTLQVLM
ncbi:MAG TPA: hypothetical protein VFY45_03600 [Baekduia sp.]|nr:hypothetical protein [Baekduia sp.]